MLFSKLFGYGNIAGHEDVYEDNEFVDQISPIWTEISEVLESTNLSVDEQYDEIQLLLNGMEKETYLHPDSDLWSDQFYDKLTPMLDDQSYDTMIMTEYANLAGNGEQGFARLETYLDGREGFESYEVRGDTVTQAGGLGGGQDWLLKFYYDIQGCKLILVGKCPRTMRVPLADPTLTSKPFSPLALPHDGHGSIYLSTPVQRHQ